MQRIVTPILGSRTGSGGGGGGGGGTFSGDITVDLGDTQALELVGTADVSVPTQDDLDDTGIDMPAVVSDLDMFVIGIGAPHSSQGYSETCLFSGKDWNDMTALTTAQESANSITVSISQKLLTLWFRRTTSTGTQTQNNPYIAKGSDGVSVFFGDNHSATEDPTLTIWKFKAVVGEVVTTFESAILTNRTFAEAPEPDANNLHDIVNIEGVLYENLVRYHTGHDKSVTWSFLTDTNFLGVRYSRPGSPSVNQFFFNRSLHRFERWEASNSGLFTHAWHPYNPFASGNEWAASGRVFRGEEVNQTTAFARVSAEQQAFIDQATNSVIYASAFTAAAAGYNEYYRAAYYPPSPAPTNISIFYGTGQTERFPDTFTDIVPTSGTYYRYQFAQENPDEQIGNPFGARMLRSSQASNTDLMTSETLADFSVLYLQPGSYKLRFNARHRVTDSGQLSLWVYFVQSGTDDYLVKVQGGLSSNASTEPPGFTAIDDANRVGEDFEWNEILTLTEEKQITFIGGTFGTGTGENGFFSLAVEKIA